jgi:hypothetical protein
MQPCCRRRGCGSSCCCRCWLIAVPTCTAYPSAVSILGGRSASLAKRFAASAATPMDGLTHSVGQSNVRCDVPRRRRVPRALARDQRGRDGLWPSQSGSVSTSCVEICSPANCCVVPSWRGRWAPVIERVRRTRARAENACAGTSCTAWGWRSMIRVEVALAPTPSTLIFAAGHFFRVLHFALASARIGTGGARPVRSTIEKCGNALLLLADSGESDAVIRALCLILRFSRSQIR